MYNHVSNINKKLLVMQTSRKYALYPEEKNDSIKNRLRDDESDRIKNADITTAVLISLSCCNGIP